MLILFWQKHPRKVDETVGPDLGAGKTK